MYTVQCCKPHRMQTVTWISIKTVYRMFCVLLYYVLNVYLFYYCSTVPVYSMLSIHHMYCHCIRSVIMPNCLFVFTNPMCKSHLYTPYMECWVIYNIPCSCGRECMGCSPLIILCTPWHNYTWNVDRFC